MVTMKWTLDEQGQPVSSVADGSADDRAGQSVWDALS